VSTLAVVGGGSWGTALAAHLARCGHEVRLWVRDSVHAEALARTRMAPAYLPGVSLPEGVAVSSDLARAVAGAPTALVALPAAACRAVYAAARRHLAPGAVLVSATKGLEQQSLLRMTEVAAQEAAGHPLAVLSGPSFALEVAQGQPTAVVVASAELAVAETVQQAVSSSSFRAYSSDDVVGVELAGALKNVIAIAAGIVTGLGYGQNTVAALVTRGLAEITRLAVALGGRGDTLAGLAGLGDLVLTCTGALSRNRQVGQALGAGRTLPEALAATHMVAEGVWTTVAACELADRAGVEMPIARRMRAVLHQGQAPREAVEQLMLRSLKRE
jgi:glycerol-3-phosphate dehydrogenase (NAD(P)+)